jgi:hypothetical protein
VTEEGSYYIKKDAIIDTMFGSKKEFKLDALKDYVMISKLIKNSKGKELLIGIIIIILFYDNNKLFINNFFC